VPAPALRISEIVPSGSLGLRVLPLVAVAGLLTVLSDDFLTTNNLTNVIRQSSVTGIVAIGMTVVILTAGLDLAVGSVLAFSSVAAAMFIHDGMPVPLAILAALSVGIVAGIVVGIAIAKGRVPPFVATLAMLSIARGLALTVTDGRSITGMPDSFRWIGTGSVGPIDVPVLIAGLVLASTWFVLNRTTFGRYVYAIGSNREAAKFAAVPIDRVLITVYAISGLLAAVAGLILTARLGSAQPTAEAGLEFEAIAAVVIGGTSLAGGKGGLGGTVVGVLLLGLIRNGLNLLDISSFYQGLIAGITIVIAVALQRQSSQQ